MKSISKDEALEIIFRTNGKIFTVVFIKRTNGETRVMNCRLGVVRHLRGGKKRYKPADYNLLTVFDMQKQGYRSINLDSLLELRFQGNVLEVTDTS